MHYYGVLFGLVVPALFTLFTIGVFALLSYVTAEEYRDEGDY